MFVLSLALVVGVGCTESVVDWHTYIMPEDISQPRQIALNITASLAFNIPWPLPTNVIGNYAKNQREQNVTDEFYYSAESTWHCNQNHSGLHQMSALFLLALSIVGDLTTVKMNLSLCEIKSLVIL